MSRSPKYTRAELAAAREREVEQRRQERERVRAQQEHEARMRRLAATREELFARIDELATRAAELRDRAAEAGLAGRHDELVRDLARARTSSAQATDESQAAAAAELVTAAEIVLQRVSAEANEVLARRRRDVAVAAVRTSLAAEPDRLVLDPADHGQVDKLLAMTTAAIADAASFDGLFADLARAVDEHLTRARVRRLELAEMRASANAAGGTLRRLLDEIAAADAASDLEAYTSAEEILRRLRGATDAGDVPAARRLVEEASRAGTAIAAAFDRWQTEQDRTNEIMKAMTAALPAAGLTVEAGSLEFAGSGGRFTARDAGHHPVRIAITHTDDGPQIVYHADGHDFTVEHTAEGDVAVCDLTSAMLERFHAELAKNDVETGELRWDGKPERIQKGEMPLPTGRSETRRGGR